MLISVGCYVQCIIQGKVTPCIVHGVTTTTVTVSPVGARNIKLSERFIHLKLSEVSGIPLTMSICRLLPFKESKNSFYDSIFAYSIEFDILTPRLSHFSKSWDGGIKYLHELQIAYLVNTGKQLRVNASKLNNQFP